MRGKGASPCYGCLCRTCANSVELAPRYTTAGEAVAPCFTCDTCSNYVGHQVDRETMTWTRDRWTDTCSRYIEAAKAAEARAQAARAKITVIKGGKT